MEIQIVGCFVDLLNSYSKAFHLYTMFSTESLLSMKKNRLLALLDSSTGGDLKQATVSLDNNTATSSNSGALTDIDAEFAAFQVVFHTDFIVKQFS